MTYLEIVNDVLKRLREAPVGSVSDTDYSLLIGTLVNDAKRDVENAHNWSALRTMIPVTTVNGTQEYSLTGSGDRFVLDRILDTTTGYDLTKAPISWLEQQTVIHPEAGTPGWFSFSGFDSNGDAKIKFFNIPSAVFTYNVYVYVPQAELTTNTTAVKVPGYLVAQSAYARAIAERGEDSGDMSSEAQGIYKKSLADAIAIERNRHEEEVNWEAT
jgi:hypothetical protein